MDLSKEAQAGRKPKRQRNTEPATKKEAKRNPNPVSSFAPPEQFPDPEAAFNQVLDAVATAATKEAGASGTGNAYRWHKGLAVNEAVAIARDLPKGSFKGSPLKFAVNRVLENLEAAGDTEAIKRLGNSEVSIVRGAAEAWLGEDGLNSTYGDGQLITDIAVNKAHAVASLPDRAEVKDEVLGFINANPERAAKSLAKLVKLQGAKDGAAVTKIIRDVNETAIREEVTPAQVLSNRIAELNPKPDLATIRVERGLFDSDWAAVQRIATDVEQFLGFTVDERTGLVGNTKLLERLLQYFVPRENGYEGIIQAYVDAGEMTPAQAESFRAQVEAGESPADDELAGDDDAPVNDEPAEDEVFTPAGVDLDEASSVASVFNENDSTPDLFTETPEVNDDSGDDDGDDEVVEVDAFDDDFTDLDDSADFDDDDDDDFDGDF